MKTIKIVVVIVLNLLFIHHLAFSQTEQKYHAEYDYIEPFQFGKAVFYLKGKCGILDTNYNTLIPAIYDFAEIYNKECNGVSKLNQKFLVYNDGSIFIDERFDLIIGGDSATCFAFNYKDEYNENILVNLKTKKLFKFKNVSSLYQKADNTFFVAYEKTPNDQQENILIDCNGSKIIDVPIDAVEKYSKGLMLIKKNKYTFYKGDIRNKNIVPNLGRRYISELANSNMYVLYNDSIKKRILLDSAGNFINNNFYDRIDAFYYTPNSKLLRVESGNSCGLMNFDGKFVYPLQNNFVFEESNIDDTYFLISNKGKYGLFNINDNVILQPAYKSIYLINSSKALVSVDSGYLFFNLKTQSFEQERYQKFYSINPKIIALKRDDKWGLINNEGVLLIPFEYDREISSFSFDEKKQNDNFFVVQKNKKYGIVNLSKKILVPFDYDFIDYSPTNGTFMALANYKYGRINLKNEIIIPFLYDSYQTPNGWSLKVRKDGKTGWLNYAGEILIPIEYDDAMLFSGGLAGVKKNGKWGFIDKSFKLLIPYQYDYVEYFNKGRVYVKLNGTSFFIDKEGNKVVPK